MVNKTGGKSYKKKKKSNSRAVKRKKFIDSISSGEDYLIGKVTERHNKDHFSILTMDRNPKKVYCSTQNSTVSPAEFLGYNENTIYVLIFKPKPKLTKDVTKYESIILCVLQEHEVDLFVQQHHMEFENVKVLEDDFIDFKENESDENSEEEEKSNIIFNIDDI